MFKKKKKDIYKETLSVESSDIQAEEQNDTEIDPEELKFEGITPHSSFYFKFKHFIKVFIRTVCILIFISLLCICFGRILYVPESAMTPSIQTNSQVFGIWKPLGYKRGDVVSYIDEESNQLKLGRVIAVPNEVIAISRDTIVVNNEFVLHEEKYLDKELNWAGWKKNKDTVFVKTQKDEYYLLVDNRLCLDDSRTLGNIKGSNIQAKYFISFNIDSKHLSIIK